MATIGRSVLELAPGENNPRNSEGAFLPLKDGRILFVYSRFTGNFGGDEAPADIVSRTSEDNGETWSNDRLLFHKEELIRRGRPCGNIMSVSLLRLADEAVGLFFIARWGDDDARQFLFRSYDEGQTWDEGVCCIPGRGYYVTNNDRVIRTKSGRILFPANYHRVLGDGTTNINSIDSRGVAYFYYSDDDGRTWQEAADACYPNGKKSAGLQETGVVQLKNGPIWALSRTSFGRQYESFSFDDGEHWTDPAPSRFTSPCSPILLKYLPDGRLLAVWNPTPEYATRDYSNDGGWGGRTPYVAATSADDGATWSKEFFLEDGSEDAGYCYPAILPLEDSVLIAYCAGNRDEGGTLNRLRIRKVMLSELEG